MDISVKKIKYDYNTLPSGLTWYFIGQPKTWKTSAASEWSEKGKDGVLIIDTDLGADFCDGANIVTVTSLNPPKRFAMKDGKKIVKNGKEQIEIVPPEEREYYSRSGDNKGKPEKVYSVAEIYAWLLKEWNSLPYDTIDKINKWIEEAVTKELGIESMGDGNWGADWGRARKKNLDVVVKLQNLMKKYGGNLILTSHAKQSTVTDNKVQLMPELPRGLAYGLTAKADVIGYSTREQKETQAYISFKGYDERTIGSRLRPLDGKILPFSYKEIKTEIEKYKEE